MSRVAKMPVVLPENVSVVIEEGRISVRGAHGTIERPVHPLVKVGLVDGMVQVSAVDETSAARMQSGTCQRLIASDVRGVSQKHKEVLNLVGVGYAARLEPATSSVNLSLGLSHPVRYVLPEGVTATCPSVTEIVLEGLLKQQVAQAAAEIRAFRPPEPYKGKGIRYANEKIRMKEAKKK